MINKYNELVKKIVFSWAKRYYKELYNEELDEKWDLDIMEYKGILLWPINICDEYHSLDDILMAEKYNIPAKIMQERYEKYLETEWKWGFPNLYNYNLQKWATNKTLH